MEYIYSQITGLLGKDKNHLLKVTSAIPMKSRHKHILSGLFFSSRI